MRAVNLIPEDARAGSGRAASPPTFVLFGMLAMLAVLVAVSTFASRGVSDKKAELAGLRQQVTGVQAEVASLAAYEKWAQLRDSRLDMVRGLADARFDWAATLDAVARTLPHDTWLSSLDGSSAGASTGQASQAPSTGATAGPSIKLSGCSPSQRDVAKLMPRLRTIPGVASVSLLSSESAGKSSGSSGSAAPAASGGAACAHTSFQMALGFGAAKASAKRAAPAAPPAAPQSSASTPAVPAQTGVSQ